MADWVGIIDQGKMLCCLPLETLKESVRRIDLTFPSVPDNLHHVLPNVLTCTQSGKQASFIVRDYSEATLAAVQALQPGHAEGGDARPGGYLRGAGRQRRRRHNVDTRHILKRLLWRESRENGLFLLAGVLLPVLLLVMRMSMTRHSGKRSLTDGVDAAFAAGFAVGDLTRQCGTAPFTPSTSATSRWRRASMPPCHFCCRRRLPRSSAPAWAAGGRWPSIVSGISAWFIWLCMTCMVANFTSCYLLSATTTLLPAVLLAAAWILPTGIDAGHFSQYRSDYPLIYRADHSLLYQHRPGGAGRDVCVHRVDPSHAILTARVSAVLLLCALPLGWFVKEQCAPRKPVDEQCGDHAAG